MFTYLRKTADINQLTNGQNGREFIGQRDRISVHLKGRGWSGLLYKMLFTYFSQIVVLERAKRFTRMLLEMVDFCYGLNDVFFLEQRGEGVEWWIERGM